MKSKNRKCSNKDSGSLPNCNPDVTNKMKPKRKFNRHFPQI